MRGDGFSLARNLPHKNKIVDRVSENPYSHIFHAAISFQINPFHVNVPFLYPLKTSENQQVMAPNQLCKLLKIRRIIFSFFIFFLVVCFVKRFPVFYVNFSPLCLSTFLCQFLHINVKDNTFETYAIFCGKFTFLIP